MQFVESRENAKDTFPDLDVTFSEEAWGPISGAGLLSSLGSVAYAHFDKKERCYRIADFTLNPANMRFQPKPRRFDENMQNADFTYRHDAVEDSSFQLVDTSKAQSRSKFGVVRKTWAPLGGRGIVGRGGRASTEPLVGAAAAAGRGRGRPQQAKAKQYKNRKVDRSSSVTVGSSWVVMEEFDLSQMTKLTANKPTIEDLSWHGHLDQYDEAYDKVSARAPKTLRRVENKVFYGVTTTEDPVLENYAVEGVGNVFATDQILAHLIAAPRSVYSWDIVIQKVDGSLFFDKRSDSQFDLLTVSETSNDPPVASDDIDEMNHPDKLSLEATMINQSFSQQILKSGRKKYEENPFFEDAGDGLEPASIAYRYRKFSLGSDINIVARCEIHAWAIKSGAEQLLNCFALNEWDSRVSGGIEWRQKIDQQKGAVLGTELKNNSCKLAKWTAQSLLSGADLMKFGYVSRVTRTNPYDHQILATQFFKPKDFATQIALNTSNVWGIIKMIAELLLSQEDGKFVLLKDPNKAIIRLYSVPPNTFESDEDDDEEYVSDGDGLDDDN